MGRRELVRSKRALRKGLEGRSGLGTSVKGVRERGEEVPGRVSPKTQINSLTD